MAGKNFNISSYPVQPIPLTPRFRNLIGKRFNRLLVLDYCGKKSPLIPHLWKCECVCGKIKIIRACALISGNTQSCGCLRNEGNGIKNVKHKEANKTTEYCAYISAKQRCNNPKTKYYTYYGGRGIKFLFNSFEEFLAEVGRKPTPQHSIDRINADGHYEKGNVRWATKSEQTRNKRNNRYITINGETKIVADWAKTKNLPPGTIWWRLHLGWCEHCAITIPLKSGKCIHRIRRKII